MERDNYYILLELSINPPETSPETIESAINRKQSEWSRLRNHPTKGLQAQKYISMIPEIRRVMTNPALREKEAAAAKTSSSKDKTDKIVEIDRHIDILMGKGFISKEEIVRLTQLHGMAEEEIQDRVRIKKDEKYVKIDRQLSLRMAKGYITEEEINKIAKRHGLKPEDVKSRVYIPMVKNGREKPTEAPRQMDRSLEKSIRENLKIVGKTSLYDFLSQHESVELEALQAAALEKKKKLSGAGKKDARVTAGNILAGHCATIFKSEESRISYDISLAKSKLAELDSDIDISGFKGKIRHEYFEILVQKAMDFGMEKHEAERYIKIYCKRKNWTIEQPAGKKRRVLLFVSAIVIVIVAVSFIGFFYMNHRHDQALKKEYSELIARVERTDNPDEQVAMLRAYITANQAKTDYAAYVDDARRHLDLSVSAIAEKRYLETSDRVSELIGEESFDAARSHLDQYLKTNPPAPFAERARRQMVEIESLAEQNDFEKLSRTIIEAGTAEKINAITHFMEKYPEGEKTAEARGLLDEMSSEYYFFVKNAIETAEENENWTRAAELAQRYIEIYDNSHADRLKPERDRFRSNLRNQRLFQSLKQKAAGFGDDYARASGVYTDFLNAYPNTPIKSRITEEMDRLNHLARQAAIERAESRLTEMIKASSGRFMEKGKGVFADAETGLMWTLLDSDITGSQRCMTFDASVKFAESLSVGGFSDWRLPTAAELMGLYGKNPSFPVFDEKWYWSSNSYSGYSDGWYRIVDTIDVFSDKRPAQSRRDSRECGAVRAVRNQ